MRVAADVERSEMRRTNSAIRDSFQPADVITRRERWLAVNRPPGPYRAPSPDGGGRAAGSLLGGLLARVGERLGHGDAAVAAGRGGTGCSHPSRD